MGYGVAITGAAVLALGTTLFVFADDRNERKYKHVDYPQGSYYGEVNENNKPHGEGIMLYSSTKHLPKAVAPGSIYKGLQ
jgi:hypothetical protein